jgi:hypothetical protein
LHICAVYPFQHFSHHSCIPHITEYTDWHLLLPAALYISLAYLLQHGITQHNTAVLKSLCLVVIPFTPAAQIAFPIGTVLAERLLYVPSIGFCALIGCCIYTAVPHSNRKQNSSSNTVYSKTNSDNNKRNAATKSVKNSSTGHNNTSTATADTNINTSIHTKSQHTTSLKGGILYSVTVLWLVACAYKSYTRCIDWQIELSLFESALKVCPNGIKTLNNLAFLKLFPETAAEAGVLLDRALQVKPTACMYFIYASAYMMIAINQHMQCFEGGNLCVSEGTAYCSSYRALMYISISKLLSHR